MLLFMQSAAYRLFLFFNSNYRYSFTFFGNYESEAKNKVKRPVIGFGK